MEVDTNELLHRIGAVLRVISNKMDQLIEIVERAGGEVWFPSEEESKTFADILMDDACIPSDAVADEPPKKWRILEPGEVVCSSDWVTAKTSPPSDPPNGLGWRPVDASVGTSVCQDDPCIFARLVAAEPAKEAEPEHPAGPMPDPGEGYRILAKNPPEDLQPGDEYRCHFHREKQWVESTRAREGYLNQLNRLWYRRKIEASKPPEPEYREPVLPGDAGKVCEFSDDGNDWTEGKLRGYTGCFWQSVFGELVGFGELLDVKWWTHARIKKDA